MTRKRRGKASVGARRKPQSDAKPPQTAAAVKPRRLCPFLEDQREEALERGSYARRDLRAKP